MATYAIVGGVAGGAGTAARLRRLDENAEIIIFERGEYISYANCGLPYYAGGTITDRSRLFIMTPEKFREALNVTAKTSHEVISINRAEKTIRVRNLKDGSETDQSYDTLVLSPGAAPVRPPIPGIDDEAILTLRSVRDVDAITSRVDSEGTRRAVIVGGGFIGLEMAENLKHAGIAVSLIEALDQVMSPIDFEMAQLLHESLEQNGVDLHLGDAVESFNDVTGGVEIKLKSGKVVSAELVILSIGVRPNGQLAKDAGLKVNARGGIVVDDHMLTSDPSVYAVGDVIEIEDFISKESTMIPLAGPANKQGRIAADNIAGLNAAYTGTQGSSIAQVFDLTVASTGENEKTLVKRGLVKGKDFESIIITQNNHASYYPGAVPMTLKLLFTTDGKQILGAQIVGRDGVDKRIDVIGVATRLGAAVTELKELEFAYAPPYSSAKDPVNMLGFVAENVLGGLVRFAPWNIAETNKDAVLLDVREDAELLAYALPGAKHIPLGQLRDRLGELDKSKPIVTFCAIGVRSYNAARILSQNGFTNVMLYPGGTRFYQSTHYKEVNPMPYTKNEPVHDSGHAETANIPVAAMRVDCSGMQCPGPIMKVFETMKEMKDGQVMEVSASDPGFAKDIVAWARRTGNTLLANEKRGNDYVALVKKGTGAVVTQQIPQSPAGDGKTIIVFSGDLDRVLASFIIANGAAAMGRPVTMFFTFWGLNVLRKANKVKVQKSFIEAMFGGMMPRGTTKLKLSKLNMGGMGTAMMKMVMKQKNVDSLETLIQKAMKAGVKIVACTMSMDIMGIKEEELIDGVELGGVGAYLGDAEESNVNLFI